jgi:hypothetical protein
MNVITKTVALPDGRTISIETGKLAKQADGSVVVRMGNTMLLATVCCAKDAVPGTDFMPLTVEYKEKFGVALAEDFPNSLKKSVKYLELVGDNLRIKDEYLYVQNSILMPFIEEIEG